MNTPTIKRVNVTLPTETLRLLDRVAQKGDRSGFVDRAVRFYVEETGRANLKKQLRRGAVAHAKRDLSIAEEWFPLEEEVWQKSPNA
ncbi:hypothetical protein A3A38_05000 [Candidatus Kaiserbacteria bacterium RIFCSPLOWO2_01_FULL_53_17]|uniref:Ribbon-helix-helix protein CopG domain-containing protein n=1 Tax=Candidatus Kaiserbacteria bacterium RIFCSPLOWO2_01_FULL_53_17 TaxID=1798511 RepID=A0A1F6EGS9_9BACT|nr:MAG: hypothetical protein A3A38_05000 [Candidatus Kaiserbacteria bacterium RIFCSPLOWO2_01_FULL_53_17]